MLLSHDRLCRLIHEGVIIGSNVEHVNSASIDICLGRLILVEDVKLGDLHRVELNKKGHLRTREFDLLRDGSYVLGPGEFVLAQSIEMFHLPRTISAEYKLKSSMARIGLEHLNAGWCDAGWHGSVLTLELKNMTRGHDIVLQHGDRIGQMVFFEHDAVPEDKSYAKRGSYNNDRQTTGVKTS
jgi:dCTP deaminase